MTLKTIGDVIAEYIDHPEAKFADAAGLPCGPATRGQLRRRHIIAESTGLYIGKEANRLDEVEAGAVHAWSEVQPVILDPTRDPVITELLPLLRKIALTRIAKAIGRSTRQVQDYRNGKVRPPVHLLPILWRIARENDDETKHPTKRTTSKRKPRTTK